MLSQLRRSTARAVKGNSAITRAVRATYPALTWMQNRPAVYARVAPYLAGMEFDEVRLGGRGNEPETHLRRTNALRSVAGADVLVAGAGAGQELALWQQQRPRSLTAIDFTRHPGAWATRDAVRFAQMDARALAFDDGAFDLVASTALLEHVDRVDDAAAEMARVTRPGGLVFANFGPLFYTYGGAHYEGAFEHLFMNDEQLERYLVARGIESELQDGLVWLRNGMFSRMRYREYLAVFRAHFDMAHVQIAISPAALRYKRAHPDVWRSLNERFAEEDLLTFAMTAWMRPKVRAASRLRRPARLTPPRAVEDAPEDWRAAA